MPKHILIVDDSEVVRGATQQFLESEAGLQVCGQAVDGLDALEKAHSLGPDLIILDLAMPRMDGLHAARALRERKVRAPIFCLPCTLMPFEFKTLWPPVLAPSFPK